MGSLNALNETKMFSSAIHYAFGVPAHDVNISTEMQLPLQPERLDFNKVFLVNY